MALSKEDADWYREAERRNLLKGDDLNWWNEAKRRGFAGAAAPAAPAAPVAPAKPAKSTVSVADQIFPRGTPAWMLSSSPAAEGENVSDPTNPFAYIPEDQKTEQGKIGKAISRGVQNTMRVGAGLAQGTTIDPAIAIAQMLPFDAADQFAKSGAAEYEKFRKGMGGEGFDASRLIGNVVSPAGIKGAQLVNKGFGMWGKTPGLVKQGATQGALAASLQPVVQDPTEEDPSFWGEKAKQVGIGSVLGGGLNKLIGASRTGQQFQNPQGLPATPQQLAQQAKTPVDDVTKYRQMFPDADLTWGQHLGDGWARREQAWMSSPWVGDVIRRAREKSLMSQNLSMMNKALEPAGIKLDKGSRAGREMFDDAYTQLSKKYDDILDKTSLSNPAQLRTKIFGSGKIDDMGNVDQGAIGNQYQMLSEAGQKRFDDLIEKGLFQKFGKDPSGQHSVQMTGRQFKNHEEGLKKTIDSLSQGTGEERQIAMMLKDSLGEAYQNLQGSAQGVSKELKDINKAYAQYKTLEKASTASSLSQGVFNPGQIVTAAGRKNTGRGHGLLQPEAELSQRVLGKPVPDSGTAERLGVRSPTANIIGGMLGSVADLVYSPTFTTLATQSGRKLGQSLEGTRLGGFAARHSDRIVPGAVSYNRSPARQQQEEEEEFSQGGLTNLVQKARSLDNPRPSGITPTTVNVKARMSPRYARGGLMQVWS